MYHPEVSDEESDDDFCFFGGPRFNSSASKKNRKGKGPAQKKKTQEYFARKWRSLQKYGESESRPQDTDGDFLLYRRKLNFGVIDEGKMHFVSPWSSDLLRPKVYKGGVIKPFSNAFAYIEQSNITDFQKWKGSLVDDISVDLEFNDQHSYLGMTCLLQIGSKTVDLVVNATELHQLIRSEIKPILEDSQIVKVVFGGANDFLNLKRDFGIQAQAVLDLQLFFHEVFLAGSIGTIMDLVENDHATKWFQDYFGSNYSLLSDAERVSLQRSRSIAKKISYDEFVHLFYPQAIFDPDAQVADFRCRQTEPFGDLLQYARGDVHYLLRIHTMLKKVYSRLDGCFKKAVTSSSVYAGKSYKRRQFPDAKSDMIQAKLTSPKNVTVRDEDVELFGVIHLWREQYAKIMDEPPMEIIKNNDLLNLVLRRDSLRRTADVSALAKSLTLQLWAPIVYRLLKEGDYRNEVMKKIKCKNCGESGHVNFACYNQTNLSLVKQNTKDHYAANPDQKSWQNYRRQTQKNINKRKKRILGLQEKVIALRSQPSSRLRDAGINELTKEIAGLESDVRIAEESLQKRREVMLLNKV